MTIFNSVNELIVNKLTPILPAFANLDFPHFPFDYSFYTDLMLENKKLIIS